ncbi:phage portal protein, partial [Shigella flexneri]
TFNFNRTMNDLEQSQIGAQSQYLSKETIVRHHPWVDDPQAELERIEQEQIEYNQQLPDIDDGGAVNGEQEQPEQKQSEDKQPK